MTSFASENTGIHVLFLGDSLTAGYGVSKTDSFVGLLDAEWKKKNPKNKMINAGVSGSTSASCTKRLKWQLRTKLDAVVVALGANDGLRGIPVDTTFKNLDQCIQLAKDKKLKVVLAGMLMPKNYGETYRKDFKNIFQKLNKKHKLRFIPFLLEGVGGVASLNLADGIHPNEKGHRVIFKKLNTELEKWF